MIISRTLKALSNTEEEHELSSDIVCRNCANAIWIEGRIRMKQDESSGILKCYCPIFFTETWSTQDPVEYTNCDAFLEYKND